MRSRTGRYITLIAGLLVAISAILSQTVAVYSTSDQETVTVADLTDAGTEQSQPEKTFVRLSPTSLPTPTFISFNHEAICLFEILFFEDSSSPQFETAASPLVEFFSILLGVVISPNAP